MRANLTATFLTARAFLREVERNGHGSLVMISSTAGVFGEASRVPRSERLRKSGTPGCVRNGEQSRGLAGQRRRHRDEEFTTELRASPKPRRACGCRS